MAGRPRIKGRHTSLAHAFVHAIIPRHVDKVHHQSLLDQAGMKPGECVYCGGKATDVDHLFGLVREARPSGYFHSPENLVPSCGLCNQSKGSKHWKDWMLGKAKGSPTRRQIPDVALRVERLSIFAEVADSSTISAAQLREAAGEELWRQYWAKLDTIKL